MRVPTNNNRIQILAIAALATCAVALTWSASALARPIDDPALPAGVASSDPAQPTPYSGAHPGLSDFGVKAPNAVVGYHAQPNVPESQPAPTAASPQSTSGSDTLPIVLASTALLLAVGGIGFTVVAGGRMRRSPQPGA